MSDERNSGLSAFDSNVVATFHAALRTYADTLTANFASTTQAQPEDQLKAPVGVLLVAAGRAAGKAIVSRTESRVEGVAGRPDLGVDANGLPVGNVELKAPGNGARPEKFSDKRSRDQFDRFKKLPNLIYTDGREWSLFRDGVMQGDVVTLASDPTKSGGAGISLADAKNLLEVLGVFFRWDPVVPSSPRALAAMLAPLTRLLRDEVLADAKAGGVMETLAEEWKTTLFPDADEATFADGYAQTFTYALLLARLEGAPAPLNAETAAKELDADHALLAQTLRVLGQPGTRDAIGFPVGLIERTVSAVDAAKLSRNKDPWLYFYEDFLAAYDPEQRNNRGVYFTPYEVVSAQVRLCDGLLVDRFDRLNGFGDPSVVALDPAAGTGTYPLTIAAQTLAKAAERGGEGLRAEVATNLANNLNAFELLVGPYAVSHLRLARTLTDVGAKMPAEGVNVFLTDTLAAPADPGFAKQATLFQRRLAAEQERASKVKTPNTHVTVVIGNPPYDRDTSGYTKSGLRKGGMVRHGDTEGSVGLLRDFLDPLPKQVRQDHGLNLYNDYVYFWRWAIWKTCEQHTDHGITSFITAASYLNGPAYGGMREMIRRHYDEVWVIDLGGEGRGARKEENVFEGVLTPVAIAIAVRLPDVAAEKRRDTAAVVRYRRYEGSRADKLAALDALDSVDGQGWAVASDAWQDSFVPAGATPFASWPSLSNVFGWTPRGIQFSRAWPIAESKELAEQRWTALLDAAPDDRGALVNETRDAQASKSYKSFLSGDKLPPIATLAAGTEPDGYHQVGFRSFDRQWCVADRRVIDMPRPPLWGARSAQQVFLTAFPTGRDLTTGPAVVANSYVPDLNSFNNRGGLVFPLWKDAAATEPNIPKSVCDAITKAIGQPVSAEDVCAYVFALLGTGAYISSFEKELASTTVRVPFTADAELFAEVATLGRELLWWATFGERFQPLDANGKPVKRLPVGTAKNQKAVPVSGADYPATNSYDPATKTITVGEGTFAPVPPEVWDFEVSGLKVVQSWLGYRMKKRAGKRSSALDDLRPDVWTFSAEFVGLLAVIERFVAASAQAAQLLERVLEGDILDAEALPALSDAERKEPEDKRSGKQQVSLFG